MRRRCRRSPSDERSLCQLPRRATITGSQKDKMQAFAPDTRELLEDRVPSIKDLGHTDPAT